MTYTLEDTCLSGFSYSPLTAQTLTVINTWIPKVFVFGTYNSQLTTTITIAPIPLMYINMMYNTFCDSIVTINTPPTITAQTYNVGGPSFPFTFPEFTIVETGCTDVVWTYHYEYYIAMVQ